ncbi:Hypothetical protein SMAX5B_015004 [Scophthalmus maximus]|uniref:Uncharacterized protein n=1 Tax=Scophthalmus maximus TaxID=52904 RepID=A0A2U9C1E1_SCOMX|nr:Hypothetical protein SMAX5B_015004 [Scophthalmus maximus]
MKKLLTQVVQDFWINTQPVERIQNVYQEKEGDQLVDSLSFRRRRFVKARCISNAAAANERRAPSRRQGTRVGAGAGET